MAYPDTLLEKKLASYDYLGLNAADPTVKALARQNRGGNGSLDGVVVRALNAAGMDDKTDYKAVQELVLKVLTDESVYVPPVEQPPVIGPAVPLTAITHYAFRQRLLPEEKLKMDGIEFAAYPSAAELGTQAGQLVAQVKTWINDFWAGQWVDLGQAALQGGLTSLEGTLIGVGRAAVIYGTPILDSERPTI